MLALTLSRSRDTPLRTHEWLLLGLGLSTFFWFALLLVVVWMVAIRWREGLNVQVFGERQFKVLQAALIGLSLVAVFALVLAIPYGLLASPDMRIAGAGQSFGPQEFEKLPVERLVVRPLGLPEVDSDEHLLTFDPAHRRLSSACDLMRAADLSSGPTER